MLLDSFPRVLWINLDRSQDRRRYMTYLLDKHKIVHTRISAIDGITRVNGELEKICKKHDKLTRAENACTCSHLKALKYFVENMKDDKVIIFEDDVSFEFLKYIPYNWSEFESNLPQKYNIIQLALTCEGIVPETKLVKTNVAMKYYCSAAYLITKQAAHNILNSYISKDTGKIILSNKKCATADSMISNNTNVYSIPIFTYLTNHSIIHPGHFMMHSKTKQQQLIQWINVWKNKSSFNKSQYFSNWKKI